MWGVEAKPVMLEHCVIFFVDFLGNSRVFFIFFLYGLIGLYGVSVVAVLINGCEPNIIDMRNIKKVGWQ